MNLTYAECVTATVIENFRYALGVGICQTYETLSLCEIDYQVRIGHSEFFLPILLFEFPLLLWYGG